MPGHNEGIRRDSKHRVLRRGESVRPDGRYQFKYSENGKAKFLFSWRLEPTDKLPPGKKPCLSLRELERLLHRDQESGLKPLGKTITVNELIERYIQTKTGVRPNTRMGYQTVINLMKNEEFW